MKLRVNGVIIPVVVDAQGLIELCQSGLQRIDCQCLQLRIQGSHHFQAPVVNNVRAVSLFQDIQDDIQKIAAGAGFNGTWLEVQLGLKCILGFLGRNKPDCQHSRQHYFLAFFSPLEMAVRIVARR